MNNRLKRFIIIWALIFIEMNIFIFALPISINGKTILEVVTTVGFIYAGSVNGLFDINKITECIKYSIRNIDEAKEYVETAKVILNSADRDIILGKYGSSFWIGYTVIVASFIILLIAIIYVFRKENDSKMVFYKFPIVIISYSSLLFLNIVCLLCMFIPKFPLWLCIVLCVIGLIINIIPLIYSDMASDAAISKDIEIEYATSFMKEMTVKAKTLYDKDRNNDELRKLYEAFRYANPMSNDYTFEIEERILSEFNMINNKNLNEKVETIIELIKERENNIR